ncbi:MAG: anti-sigma factor domain-containing protein [Actinomycetota bacterium]
MSCDTVLERIARGDWEDDEVVSSHLAVCPECRMRLPPAEALGRYLRDPLFWEAPPDRLSEDVVAAVTGESRTGERRPRWWVWGAVAVLAVVAALGLGLGNRPDWSMQLVAGPAAPGASASVEGWNTGNGTRMVVDVSGLEPTGPDAYYEMWLTAPDGRHVSAGTFRESGRFEMIAGVARRDFPRVWITWEPADHDTSPFPATVLDTPDI